MAVADISDEDALTASFHQLQDTKGDIVLDDSEHRRYHCCQGN